jgi:hypothetical protein
LRAELGFGFGRDRFGVRGGLRAGFFGVAGFGAGRLTFGFVRFFCGTFEDVRRPCGECALGWGGFRRAVRRFFEGSADTTGFFLDFARARAGFCFFARAMIYRAGFVLPRFIPIARFAASAAIWRVDASATVSGSQASTSGFGHKIDCTTAPVEPSIMNTR